MPGFKACAVNARFLIHRIVLPIVLRSEKPGAFIYTADFKMCLIEKVYFSQALWDAKYLNPLILSEN